MLLKNDFNSILFIYIKRKFDMFIDYMFKKYIHG
jgi:hypothetical protein